MYIRYALHILPKLSVLAGSPFWMFLRDFLSKLPQQEILHTALDSTHKKPIIRTRLSSTRDYNQPTLFNSKDENKDRGNNSTKLTKSSAATTETAK